MPLVATRGNAGVFGLGWGAPAGGAADAMTAIASTTLASNTGSVTFSSISSDYDDLMLVNYFKVSTQSANSIWFNGDLGSNYAEQNLANFRTLNVFASKGNAHSTIGLDYSGFVSADFGAQIIHIIDYKNTTKYKTVLARTSINQSQTDCETNVTAGVWLSTSAINQITLGASYASGSVFALYGITKA